MLNFELQLDERLPDRVFISVLLSPEGGEATVDGVAVMLVGPQNERLSSRLVLPIAGTLIQPLLTTVEVRALQPIPAGARIVGSAWNAEQQWEAHIPADPGTQLEAHCRGSACVRPEVDRALAFESLGPDELAALHATFPWLQPSPPPLLRVVEQDEEQLLREACDDLGLDEDEAAWLEELLRE